MVEPSLSVRQIKAARALLGWTQSDLAARSGLSEPTVKRVESVGAAPGVSAKTMSRIRIALEGAGIEFIMGEEPGLRLTKL